MDSERKLTNVHILCFMQGLALDIERKSAGLRSLTYTHKRAKQFAYGAFITIWGLADRDRNPHTVIQQFADLRYEYEQLVNMWQYDLAHMSGATRNRHNPVLDTISSQIKSLARNMEDLPQ